MRCLELAATGSFDEALLSLLEVDHVPNGVEVLEKWVYQCREKSEWYETTHTSGLTFLYWM